MTQLPDGLSEATRGRVLAFLEQITDRPTFVGITPDDDGVASSTGLRETSRCRWTLPRTALTICGFLSGVTRGPSPLRRRSTALLPES
jgi:hypothetical protein